MTARGGLAGDIHQAVIAAVSTVLNHHGAPCPALCWTLQPSQPTVTTATLVATGSPPTDRTPRQARAELDQWVQAFGLGPPVATTYGTVEYPGMIEDVPVTIWMITDHDAFTREPGKPT